MPSMMLDASEEAAESSFSSYFSGEATNTTRKPRAASYKLLLGRRNAYAAIQRREGQLASKCFKTIVSPFLQSLAAPFPFEKPTVSEFDAYVQYLEELATHLEQVAALGPSSSTAADTHSNLKWLRKCMKKGLYFIENYPLFAFDNAVEIFTSSEEEEPFESLFEGMQPMPSSSAPSWRYSHRFPPHIRALRGIVRSFKRRKQLKDHTSSHTRADHQIPSSARNKQQLRLHTFRKSFRQLRNQLTTYLWNQSRSAVDSTLHQQWKSSPNAGPTGITQSPLHSVLNIRPLEWAIQRTQSDSLSAATILVDFLATIFSLSGGQKVFSFKFKRGAVVEGAEAADQNSLKVENVWTTRKFYIGNLRQTYNTVFSGGYLAASMDNEGLYWIKSLRNGYFTLQLKIQSKKRKRRLQQFSTSHHQSKTNSVTSKASAATASSSADLKKQGRHAGKAEAVLQIDRDSSENEEERSERLWEEQCNSVLEKGFVSVSHKRCLDMQYRIGLKSSAAVANTAADGQWMKPIVWSTVAKRRRLPKKTTAGGDKFDMGNETFSSSEASEVNYMQDQKRFRHGPSMRQSQQHRVFGRLNASSSDTPFSVDNPLKAAAAFSVQPITKQPTIGVVEKSRMLHSGSFERMKRVDNEMLMKSLWKVHRKPRVRSFDPLSLQSLENDKIMGIAAAGMDALGREVQFWGIDKVKLHHQCRHTKHYRQLFRTTEEEASLRLRREYIVVIDETTHTVKIYLGGTLNIFLVPSELQKAKDYHWKRALSGDTSGMWKEHLVNKSLRYNKLLDLDSSLLHDEIQEFLKVHIDYQSHALWSNWKYHEALPITETELAEKSKDSEIASSFFESMCEFAKCDALSQYFLQYQRFVAANSEIPYSLEIASKSLPAPDWLWKHTDAFHNFSALLTEYEQKLRDYYVYEIYPVFLEKYCKIREQFAKNYAEEKQYMKKLSEQQGMQDQKAVKLDTHLIRKQLDYLSQDTKYNEFTKKEEGFQGSDSRQQNYEHELEHLRKCLPSFNLDATAPGDIFRLEDVIPDEVLNDYLLSDKPFLNALESSRVLNSWSSVVKTLILNLVGHDYGHLQYLKETFGIGCVARILKLLQWLILVYPMHHKTFSGPYWVKSHLYRVLAAMKWNGLSINLDMNETSFVPDSFCRWIYEYFMSFDESSKLFFSHDDECRLLCTVIWVCLFLSSAWTFDFNSLLTEDWRSKYTDKFLTFGKRMGLTKNKKSSDMFIYALSAPIKVEANSRIEVERLLNIFSKRPRTFVKSKS